MPPLRPKVREDLAVVELDGEAVVYDEANNLIHHLNPTATIIFNLCDGQSTVQQLAGEISSVFDVEAGEVERQIRAILRQFREQKFLPQPAQARTRSRNNGGKVGAKAAGSRSRGKGSASKVAKKR